jgi:hypothetical protein
MTGGGGRNVRIPMGPGAAASYNLNPNLPMHSIFDQMRISGKLQNLRPGAQNTGWQHQKKNMIGRNQVLIN